MNFEKKIIGDCTLYRGDCLELLAAGVFGKIGAVDVAYFEKQRIGEKLK